MQLLKRDIAHIHAINKHAALGNVIKARDEAHQSRLAHTGGTDQGDSAAGGYFQIDVREHFLARIVVKTNVLKADIPTNGLGEFVRFRR